MGLELEWYRYADLARLWGVREDYVRRLISLARRAQVGPTPDQFVIRYTNRVRYHAEVRGDYAVFLRRWSLRRSIRMAVVEL